MNHLTTASDIAPPDALLTQAQAAALLSIQPETLAAWRSTKRVHQPAFVKVGAAVRYRRADIDAYIAASVVQEA